jgi:hypothetical protein
MSEDFKHRRGIIRAAGAMIACGALLPTERSALAWHKEEMEPGSAAGMAYANHCGGPLEHVALQSKLRGLLAASPSLNSTSANCPLCGCPVIVGR